MNAQPRNDVLTLEILQAIETQSDVTQRRIASRSGVALGLANAYLKRCVRKGLVQVRQAPANRYLYYLTPKGFHEKSRLTAEYLASSFSFYREAGESLRVLFKDLLADHAPGRSLRVGLYGVSDLAEIAVIRALSVGIEVAEVCDPLHCAERFLQFEVVSEPRAKSKIESWVLTSLGDPQAAYTKLVATVGPERVRAPGILGVRETPA
jgi:DNA-binding MarR family transcriptional regulator